MLTLRLPSILYFLYRSVITVLMVQTGTFHIQNRNVWRVLLGPCYYHGLTLILPWISNHMLNKAWYELPAHCQIQRLRRWRLKMDKQINSTNRDSCNCLSMLGSKIIYACKRCPVKRHKVTTHPGWCVDLFEQMLISISTMYSFRSAIYCIGFLPIDYRIYCNHTTSILCICIGLARFGIIYVFIKINICDWYRSILLECANDLKQRIGK